MQTSQGRRSGGGAGSATVPERFQELLAELEALVDGDPTLVIEAADPIRDGEAFVGGVVVRPREPALERYAEMRIAPCLAEVFLQPEQSSAHRSVLALEEGFWMDTCERESAGEMARVLIGTLENHLAWLDDAEEPG